MLHLNLGRNHKSAKRATPGTSIVSLASGEIGSTVTATLVSSIATAQPKARCWEELEEE